jgi:hypothetical protein
MFVQVNDTCSALTIYDYGTTIPSLAQSRVRGNNRPCVPAAGRAQEARKAPCALICFLLPSRLLLSTQCLLSRPTPLPRSKCETKGVSIFFSGSTLPLRSKCETDSIFSDGDTPLPRSKRETEGVLSSTPTPTPSLGPNARQRGFPSTF